MIVYQFAEDRPPVGEAGLVFLFFDVTADLADDDLLAWKFGFTCTCVSTIAPRSASILVEN